MALTLFLALLCSCGEGETVTTVAVETTEPKVTDYVPTSVDYGGDEFLVLTAGNVAFDDFSEDVDSNAVLDKALFERKEKVESEFNIEIISEVKQERSLGGGPGYMSLANDYLSGTTTYDASLIAGYDAAVLAYSNLIFDLNSLPGLDLSRPYWDQNANRDLSINGVMYFTTGDITVSDNNALFTLLFNKKLIEDYDLTSPYEYVKNNNWTLETFAGLVKQVSEDLNGDGLRDENDRYGLLVWDDAVMGIINGIGEKCATVSDDGTITLTLYNERTSSALDKYFDIIYDETTALCYQRKLKSASDIWNNNQGLFWMSTLGNVPALRTMEADFGIVPYPKLDSAQESYHQTVSPYNSQFYCAPILLRNCECTGRVLDALAYYGKEIVTPAYYEKTIVGQSTRDEESVEMLDIIFSTVAYDLGYYYQLGDFNSELIYMVREYDRGFTARYESNKLSAESKLDKINAAFDTALSTWKK